MNTQCIICGGWYNEGELLGWMTHVDECGLTDEERLRSAAQALHDYLWNNSGSTADWPIELAARDEDSGRELQKRLNALKTALANYDV